MNTYRVNHEAATFWIQKPRYAVLYFFFNKINLKKMYLGEVHKFHCDIAQ